jgi:hypothetical protein
VIFAAYNLALACSGIPVKVAIYREHQPIGDVSGTADQASTTVDAIVENDPDLREVNSQIDELGR